jgi:cytochrome c oxidase subunit 4
VTATHDSHAAHAGPNIQAYLVVFGALCGFTLVSFVANFFATSGYISHFFSFVIILGVAIVKATLVGMYFMHLKWEWWKLYFLIVPVMILAVMMALVFLPDIVLAWQHYPGP